ncbi:hypothetical protein C4D23_05460 [Clostridium perfringens]|uniref:hypothetical protein n=1 Tax=Clostridium perfringens TaxID=1502 RepID=UPI002858A310|nr:hypothetical protein [Clostridium perfringens]ELC8380368.1 hypothetical protein [Clostridium perfringens]
MKYIRIIIKTLNDISGEKYWLNGISGVDIEEDIFSKKFVGYFVVYNNDEQVEVDKETYQAIKKVRSLIKKNSL